VGSSAHRSRRQVGEQTFIFDDPPPSIQDVEKPESCGVCEEVMEVTSIEPGEEEQGIGRNLPFDVQAMEID